MQTLLYLFEKQFHLPTLFVDEEHQSLISFRKLASDVAQMFWIVLAAGGTVQHDGFILDDAGAAFAQSPGDTPKWGFRLCVGDEEGACWMRQIKSWEVEISLTYNVARPGFYRQHSGDTYIVRFTAEELVEAESVVVRIWQWPHLYRRLSCAKRCSWRGRRAQIDTRRVERVGRGFQPDAEAVVELKFASLPNPALRKLCIDAPIAHIVGILACGVHLIPCRTPCGRAWQLLLMHILTCFADSRGRSFAEKQSCVIERGILTSRSDRRSPDQRCDKGAFRAIHQLIKQGIFKIQGGVEDLKRLTYGKRLFTIQIGAPINASNSALRVELVASAL